MTWIALLKAVNVAGHQPVTMAAVADAVRDAGATSVKTLLASGNVVLDSASTSAAALEERLETSFAKRLQLCTAVFVRSAEAWRAMVDANPFAREAVTDPGHLLSLALKTPASSAQVKALASAIVGTERVAGTGGSLYLVYPDGVGRSKLTTVLMERHLGTEVTGRNWNTVLKLLAAATVKDTPPLRIRKP